MLACTCSIVSCVQFYCWWTELCGKRVLILEQIIFHSTMIDMNILLCTLFAKIMGRNTQGMCVHRTLYGLLSRPYEGHDSCGYFCIQILFSWGHLKVGCGHIPCHNVNFIGCYCWLSEFVPDCCNCSGLLLGIQIVINNYLCKFRIVKFSKHLLQRAAWERIDSEGWNSMIINFRKLWLTRVIWWFQNFFSILFW